VADLRRENSMLEFVFYLSNDIGTFSEITLSLNVFNGHYRQKINKNTTHVEIGFPLEQSPLNSRSDFPSLRSLYQMQIIHVIRLI
jgi:hypothetical protein